MEKRHFSQQATGQKRTIAENSIENLTPSRISRKVSGESSSGTIIQGFRGLAPAFKPTQGGIGVRGFRQISWVGKQWLRAYVGSTAELLTLRQQSSRVKISDRTVPTPEKQHLRSIDPQNHKANF